MVEGNVSQYLYHFEPVRPELVTDPDAWTEEDIRIGEAHFAYLKKATEEGVVLLAGRSQDGEGPAIVIYEAESEDVIERRKEGSAFLFLRMVLALPLFVSLLLYILYPQALAWSQVELPLWLRSFAAVIAVLCVPLIYRVFRSIGKNISETVLTKSDHELVTVGPYRWVRHHSMLRHFYCCFP